MRRKWVREANFHRVYTKLCSMVQYGRLKDFLGDLMLFQDILIPSRAIFMAFFKMAFSK